jgi:hypothetical protein
LLRGITAPAGRRASDSQIQQIVAGIEQTRIKLQSVLEIAARYVCLTQCQQGDAAIIEGLCIPGR